MGDESPTCALHDNLGLATEKDQQIQWVVHHKSGLRFTTIPDQDSKVFKFNSLAPSLGLLDSAGRDGLKFVMLPREPGGSKDRDGVDCRPSAPGTEGWKADIRWLSNLAPVAVRPLLKTSDNSCRSPEDISTS